MDLRRASVAFIGPLQWILASLASLIAAYLVLFDRGVFLHYIKTSTLHKAIFLSAELFFCTTLYRVYLKNARSITNKLTYLFLFLIANCFFSYPFLTFYLDEARQEIPQIQAIRPYLIPAYIILLAATGACAVLARQDLGRFRTWLIGEIDAQKERDQQTESARVADYRERYAKLDHVRVIGPLVRAIYQEGWVYVLAFLALVAMGFALRVWNLAALPPYADEMPHLVTAKAIFEGQALGQVEYRRSLYTVTLPVTMSFYLFGANLWSARFAGVIFNILAVIPLYAIGRRVNKPVALLAVGLYAFNPWVIAVSRTVREYTYYPFYFYLAGWVMLKFYEGLPSGLILWKDYRKILTPANLLYASALGFALIYAMRIDRLSTFMVIYGMYLVLAIFLLRKVNWRNPGNLLIIVLVAAAGALRLSSMLNITGEVNGYFITLFYGQPEQQWYYNRPLISVAVLLLALLAADYLNKKKPVLPFFLLTYLVTILSFTFLWIQGDKPRYAIFIESWHILVMAAGLYAAHLVANRFIRNKAAVWVGLLLLFWNIPQTLVPSLQTNPGYAPITGEYHANLSAAYAYLQEQARPGDVLISYDYFDQYVRWEGGLEFDKTIALVYKYRRSEKYILPAIETYARGWIVLYSRGDDLWLQPERPKDFAYAGKDVEFVGWYGDQYILHWGN